MITRPRHLNRVQRNRLSLKLRPIFIAQLAITDILEYGAYSYEDGAFVKIIEDNDVVEINFLKSYAQQKSSEIFIHQDDYLSIEEKINGQLRNLARSLSKGAPLKNGTRQVNLLSMQMENLYKDPMNDDLLNDQFQNTKNLSTLLYNNKSIQKELFHKALKQNHHYTIAQPMLSSITLLAFLQHLGMFSEKEIQTYFLTSYFKDIGLAFIPKEKFEEGELDSIDREIFSQHAENSMKILEGRVPLNNTQLEIIKNHHFLNYKIQSIVNGSDYQPPSELLLGVESTFLSSIDILLAMTTERPYRSSIDTFKALELLKKVIADEYPQEFKILVVFIKQFFQK